MVIPHILKTMFRNQFILWCLHLIWSRSGQSCFLTDRIAVFFPFLALPDVEQRFHRTVTFVISPLASAISGAALRVDGGVVSSCS